MRHLLPILLLTLLAPATRAKTWLAVSPDPALTRALAPLADHRRAQGLEVSIATTGVDEAIATLGTPPDYLLIIGDDQLVPAKRGHQYRWLSTQNESFAADPLFSDLGGDGLPDFPVGRIPTKVPEQLAGVIAKIIAFENRAPGIGNLNLPIWSGTPAYGKLLDESADWLLMSTINKHAPDWAQPWLITANPNNTLNAWPADQAQLFNSQIQKGAAFTAMMGHGNTDFFLSMNVPDQVGYSIADTLAFDHLDKLSPPLVIFACDCGNFAHENRQSLASTLLLARGGPVATIAATTESHPLTNYYSSIALMQTMAASSREIDRVGDLWMTAQTKAHGMRKPIIERLLKNVEGALEVEIDIPKLKRDQLQMYAYLGDPALRVSLPKPLKLTIHKSADNTWAWSAEKPPGAEKLVVQHRPLSTPLRAKPAGSNREQSMQLFAQRNAQFAYQTQTELPATATWSGQTKSPGDLRVIALSKSKIHVATEKLR